MEYHVMRRFDPTNEELISGYLKNKIMFPFQESDVITGDRNPDLYRAFEFREVSGAERRAGPRWFPVYSWERPGVVIGKYRVLRSSERDETSYEYCIDPRGHPEVEGLGWEKWVIREIRRNHRT